MAALVKRTLLRIKDPISRPPVQELLGNPGTPRQKVWFGKISIGPFWGIPFDNEKFIFTQSQKYKSVLKICPILENLPEPQVEVISNLEEDVYGSSSASKQDVYGWLLPNLPSRVCSTRWNLMTGHRPGTSVIHWHPYQHLCTCCHCRWKTKSSKNKHTVN